MNTDSASPIAAELKRVTRRYGAVMALNCVDLALERARITVLLGPNGAGKTTAVKLLLGLIPPSAGEVTVFGGNPRDVRSRTRVGAMLQVGKVPETLRVSEHIDVFRTYYPAPLSRAEVLAAAGLEHLERRMYGTLSGGEKQRVLFALALCGNPDLLFLDEPTVGLDVEARRSLWERIRLASEQGRAVLLTTHYLDEADSLAHRVVVLNHGEIVADGPPAEIKRRVSGRRIRCTTALFLTDVQRIDGVDAAHRVGDTTEILTAHAEDVARVLLLRDATLSGLEIGGAGLEEAFLALTRKAEPVPAEVA